MELVVGWELLEEGGCPRSCAVEGEAGQELSLFDDGRAGSGEAHGGEVEEGEGEGEGLHFWGE